MLQIQLQSCKKSFQDFEIKNLGEYHDLCLRNISVGQCFWKLCLEICELNPARSLSASGLARQAALKKTKVELEPLTDSDMLLMVGKGIREEKCHSINKYLRVNNRYMKDYDKTKESLDVKY